MWCVTSGVSQVLVLFVILIALWFFKVCNCTENSLKIWGQKNCRRQSSCLGGATLSKWKLFATLWSPLARPPPPSSCPSFYSFFHRSSSTQNCFISLNMLIIDIFFSTYSHDALKYFDQTYDFWPFTPMKNSLKNAPSLITWRLIETKMCWGVIFLLGGGFALAKVWFSKLIRQFWRAGHKHIYSGCRIFRALHSPCGAAQQSESWVPASSSH